MSEGNKSQIPQRVVSHATYGARHPLPGHRIPAWLGSTLIIGHDHGALGGARQSARDFVAAPVFQDSARFARVCVGAQLHGHARGVAVFDWDPVRVG